MNNDKIKKLLSKYKDNLPYDVDELYNDWENKKCEAMIYINSLIKHFEQISNRNDSIWTLRAS
jgi:hypothetical protein